MDYKYENKITINIDKITIEKEYQNTLIDLSKILKISGFKKGFISKDIIINKFGIKIKNSIINKHLKINIVNYLKYKELQILDYPEIKSKSENEINYVFTIELFILPKLEININNIPIIEYKFIIMDSDINKEIDFLKLKYTKWKKISSFTENNDILNINLYEKQKNKKIYLLKNENIKLDESFFKIKDLKNHLVNKMKKREYLLNINNNIDENKKIILFINEILRKEEPIINADFFNDLNYQYNNINEFIKNKLNEIGIFLVKKIKKIQILKYLILNNEFEIPYNLIKHKIKNNNLLKNENDLKNEIKLNLILLTLKNKFNIHISEQEIYDYTKLKYNNINLEQNKNYIENEILLNKILFNIDKNLIKTYQNITFENLINIGNNYE